MEVPASKPNGSRQKRRKKTTFVTKEDMELERTLFNWRIRRVEKGMWIQALCAVGVYLCFFGALYMESLNQNENAACSSSAEI